MFFVRRKSKSSPYNQMGLRRKNRKERTLSEKMCEVCYRYQCNGMHDFLNTPYIKKIKYRLAHNLCVSCGHNPCSCKRRVYPSNIKTNKNI